MLSGNQNDNIGISLSKRQFRIVTISALCLSFLRITRFTFAVDGLSINRRYVLSLFSTGCGIVHASKNSNAACLQGDLSPSCIGVYKVPIDDNIREMVSTKEALQKYAPDINFVPPIPSPTSVSSAYENILTQRLAADDIVKVVSAGRLEEAGIKVLNLIPRLTVSGRLLVEYNDPSEAKSTQESIALLKRQQLQNLLETTEVDWKNVDVMIGQGIRGDLGVSAVAQLHILSELRGAIASLDEFIANVKR
jgi:hypothetical protein